MDRPRQRQPVNRLRWRVFKVMSISALALASIAALSLWLLVTDPVTAAAVIERGDLLPLVAALAKMAGKALSAVFAFM
jgi:hypothetical protein